MNFWNSGNEEDVGGEVEAKHVGWCILLNLYTCTPIKNYIHEKNSLLTKQLKYKKKQKTTMARYSHLALDCCHFYSHSSSEFAQVWWLFRLCRVELAKQIM